MKHILVFLFVTLFAAYNVTAKIVTETVEYDDKGTSLEGYLAYEDNIKKPMPVVVVVHDWMGMGKYVKMRCEKLAKLGYIAFAADIYGKHSQPKNSQEASKLVGLYKGNIPLLRERIITALNKAKQTKNADISRIAAIGYCFGGTTVLELARSGASIKGVVSFHGSLATPNPEDAKNIKCKVLALHGADDPFVKSDEVAAFENEMRHAKVDWQLIKYSNAVHAFTIPDAGNDNSKGAAYNELADKRSWEAMKQFFNEIFNR